MTILPLLLSLGHTYVVSPMGDDAGPGTAQKPFKTIAKAAESAGPGDTVLVRDGLYREGVRLTKSGVPAAPIRFEAEHPGKATITGADPLTGWRAIGGGVYEADWAPVFAIDVHDGVPVEHHPENAPLWGRAEQVMADGRQLTPTLGLAGLRTATATVPQAPEGWFAADTKAHKMYVRLQRGDDPNERRIEASTRARLIGCDPWENPPGVHNVQVRGFRFRYGASFPQRPAVWLHGRDNLLEDCTVEEMSGSGAGVGGTMRRCVVKGCGQTGGSAGGDGFLNEACAWIGNSWKPVDRGWDSGGVKLAVAKNGTFQRCLFRENGGPGLWLDVWDHEVKISQCVFERNEGSGLFIEICHHVTVDQCLAQGNALTAPDWGEAGIKVAESMDVSVTRCTSVDNRDGIAFREQGPRPNDTDLGPMDFHDQRVTITDNLLRGNRDYGLGLWYDNGFFGMHPGETSKYPSEAAYTAALDPAKSYDPLKQGHKIDRNAYAGAKAVLYGVPWRARHREFADLADFRKATGFEAHPPTGAGWKDAPKDVDAWVRRMLSGWVVRSLGH